MSDLPPELRALIESGPLVHLSTINADGSPQVTVIWIGLDNQGLISAHMAHRVKLRNIERDPGSRFPSMRPAYPESSSTSTP